MAHKRYPPDDPREWLNRARSNLALARRPIEGVLFEDQCFDAQQAAEKAIKAVFIHHGLSFPYTHDLARLLRHLKGRGLKIPKYVLESKLLTQFAFELRYPGLAAPVSNREYRHAVRVAERVVSWAEKHIKPHP
jgi:HEPN domain-containing protein